MKKLIAMLNLITILVGSTSSLISCFGQKSGNEKVKKETNKKNEKEDNEKDEEENSEETIEDILEKLKNLKFVAYLKADKINTISILMSELNVRKEIKSIVKDREFKITSELDSGSLLVQQTYQFKIIIENKDSKQNEEESKELSAVFQVVVKEKQVDETFKINQQLLNEVDQLLEKQLTTYNFIADAVNTYKDIKAKIKTDLINLALNKNVVLEIDFISSIFTTDEQLIFQAEKAFKIKVVLISKNSNEYSLTKTYNPISIVGFTKEQLEDIKNGKLKYEEDKILLEQLISDEEFKEKLSYSTGIKANRANTVKDLIDKLRSMNAEALFDSEKLKHYKYGFNPVESTDQLLQAAKPVMLTIFAIDQTSTSAEPFFKKDFELTVEAETNTEEFERIANRIKTQLAREENKFDFTDEKELQADGILTWTDLFNKFVKKMTLNNILKLII